MIPTCTKRILDWYRTYKAVIDKVGPINLQQNCPNFTYSQKKKSLFLKFTGQLQSDEPTAYYAL